jgi:hypothetical protein
MDLDFRQRIAFSLVIAKRGKAVRLIENSCFCEAFTKRREYLL